MKELRITKARIVEIINHYRGMYTGVADELKRGGIDPDKPYTQKLDPATGDYIYMQGEDWEFGPGEVFVPPKKSVPKPVKESDEPEKVVTEVEMPMSKKGLSKKSKKGKKAKK